MLFSVEDPKESTKKLLELIDEFTRFHLSIRLLSRVNALLTHVSGFLVDFSAWSSKLCITQACACLSCVCK